MCDPQQGTVALPVYPETGAPGAGCVLESCLSCAAVSARKCEEFLWSAWIALFDVAWD